MGMMETRVEEISSNLEEIGEISPKQMAAFHRFMKMAENRGALSPREKELISVALSITAHCEWCIAFHVKNALELGATRQEIIESAWVAVLMGGGPALMHAKLVLDAIREFQSEEDTSSLVPYLKVDDVEGRFKELYLDLLDYVDSICDTSDEVCYDDSAKRRLALNIAESDGRIMRRLVAKECNNRGWKRLKHEEPIPTNEPDPLEVHQSSIKTVKS